MRDNDSTKELFPKATTCAGRIEVPTEKEREALAALKAIKERVRVLKKQLSSLGPTAKGDTPERRAAEEEMASLKVQWKQWEERREEAIRERMILLGHQEPD